MEEYRDCDKVPATAVCNHIRKYSEDQFLQSEYKTLAINARCTSVLDPESGCHHVGPSLCSRLEVGTALA
jgi:hypothetical protein